MEFTHNYRWVPHLKSQINPFTQILAKDKEFISYKIPHKKEGNNEA